MVTVLGMRVSELYIDPLSANHVISGLKKESFDTFGIVQLLANTLEMRPQLRIKVKEAEEYNNYLFAHEEYLLQELPTIYDPSYEDFSNSIKTTKYVLDWIDEKGEDVLLQMYDIRPGEIHAKNEILDWLLYCATELSHCLEQKQHIAPLTKLRTRLKYGVKEDLLAVLQLKGVGRVRARTLANNNLGTVRALKTVQFTTLANLVGQKLAESIKTQLDAPIEKTTTLGDY